MTADLASVGHGRATAVVVTHLVDTATLAAALGITPGRVRALVGEGKIMVAERRRPRGANGRGQPTMWFDLDAVLDQRSPACDSP